jgi:hypothetical protein
MILVLIPILIAIMWAIHRHYRHVDEALLVDWTDALPPPPSPPDVVVPVRGLDRATVEALSYARSISPNVTAVHVTDDPYEAARLRQRWDRWENEVPLVIVDSPYRSLVPPLVAYIAEQDGLEPGRPITVVLPEFVPRHFWEHLLHGQTALRLKLRLFARPHTVVVDVPYHLDRVN